MKINRPLEIWFNIERDVSVNSTKAELTIAGTDPEEGEGPLPPPQTF
jgi:hypothetical protein